MKYEEKHTFYAYLNPICAALGIMGFLLYLEIDYLDIGIYGLGLWGITGLLHMGHMLNNTIQDVLVRRARMQGKNACWVPGTDHASIATEAKVVRKLRDQGIKKSDLSRDAFLEHAWDWTREHGGIILKQLRKLGASCDWDRTSFTLDEHYSRSVIDTFLDLHAKGHIYRGLRMVNWDPQALTAVSDEEVIHTEEQSKLHQR